MRSPLLPVALALLLGVAGCSHTLSPSPNAEANTPPAPSFSQFTDIPIPEDAHMDPDRTLLLGQGDAWVGRLVFTVRGVFSEQAPDLFDFFKANMPTYHWQEISSVRAAISVMTWQRGDRIATVQIEETTLGAEVILTMAPVNGPNPAAANQPPPAQVDQPPAQAGQPPAAVAPPPPVTQQPLK